MRREKRFSRIVLIVGAILLMIASVLPFDVVFAATTDNSESLASQGLQALNIDGLKLTKNGWFSSPTVFENEKNEPIFDLTVNGKQALLSTNDSIVTTISLPTSVDSKLNTQTLIRKGTVVLLKISDQAVDYGQITTSLPNDIGEIRKEPEKGFYGLVFKSDYQLNESNQITISSKIKNALTDIPVQSATIFPSGNFVDNINLGPVKTSNTSELKKPAKALLDTGKLLGKKENNESNSENSQSSTSGHTGDLAKGQNNLPQLSSDPNIANQQQKNQTLVTDPEAIFDKDKSSQTINDQSLVGGLRATSGGAITALDWDKNTPLTGASFNVWFSGKDGISAPSNLTKSSPTVATGSTLRQSMTQDGWYIIQEATSPQGYSLNTKFYAVKFSLASGIVGMMKGAYYKNITTPQKVMDTTNNPYTWYRDDPTSSYGPIGGWYVDLSNSTAKGETNDGALSATGGKLTFRDHSSYKITKLDKISKKPLSGTTFNIWFGGPAGVSALSGNFTTDGTDKDGNLNLSITATGWYVIQENQPPVGYNRSPKFYAFKYDAARGVVGIMRGSYIANYTTPQKVMDATENPYTWYDDDLGGGYAPIAGWYIDLSTTGYSNGGISSDAAFEAKNGSLSLTDIYSGFSKYDANNASNLAGATFNIWFSGLRGTTAPANKITTTPSKTNGTVQLEIAKTGWYIVQEATAPDGFSLNTKFYAFEYESSQGIVGMMRGAYIANPSTPRQVMDSTDNPYTWYDDDPSGGYTPISGWYINARATNFNKKFSSTDSMFNIQNGSFSFGDLFTGIEKVDLADNSPLEGATFKIWFSGANGTSLNTTPSTTPATVKNGRVSLPVTTTGWYVIQEATPPDGFRQNTKFYAIKYDSGRGVVGIMRGAYTKSTTTPQKVMDSTDNPYTWYDDDPGGGYAPIAGWYVDLNDQSAYEKGASTTDNYIAAKNGSLTFKDLFTGLRKSDLDTSEALEGAKFTTWFCGTQGITTPKSVGVSDATLKSGRVNLPMVDTGWYVIQETTPPAGYQINTKFYAIKYDSARGVVGMMRGAYSKSSTVPQKVMDTVDNPYTWYNDDPSGSYGPIAGWYVDLSSDSAYTEGSTTTDSFVSGKQGSIWFRDKFIGVKKVDIDTRNGLSGAKFTTWYSGTQGVSNLTDKTTSEVSADTGRIDLKLTKNGWYVIQETTVPNGYKANNKFYAFKYDTARGVIGLMKGAYVKSSTVPRKVFDTVDNPYTWYNNDPRGSYGPVAGWILDLSDSTNYSRGASTSDGYISAKNGSMEFGDLRITYIVLDPNNPTQVTLSQLQSGSVALKGSWFDLYSPPQLVSADVKVDNNQNGQFDAPLAAAKNSITAGGYGTRGFTLNLKDDTSVPVNTGTDTGSAGIKSIDTNTSLGDHTLTFVAHGSVDSNPVTTHLIVVPDDYPYNIFVSKWVEKKGQISTIMHGPDPDYPKGETVKVGSDIKNNGSQPINNPLDSSVIPNQLTYNNDGKVLDDSGNPVSGWTISYDETSHTISATGPSLAVGQSVHVTYTVTNNSLLPEGYPGSEGGGASAFDHLTGDGPDGDYYGNYSNVVHFYGEDMLLATLTHIPSLNFGIQSVKPNQQDGSSIYQNTDPNGTGKHDPDPQTDMNVTVTNNISENSTVKPSWQLTGQLGLFTGKDETGSNINNALSGSAIQFVMNDNDGSLGNPKKLTFDAGQAKALNMFNAPDSNGSINPEFIQQLSNVQLLIPNTTMSSVKPKDNYSAVMTYNLTDSLQ